MDVARDVVFEGAGEALAKFRVGPGTALMSGDVKTRRIAIAVGQQRVEVGGAVLLARQSLLLTDSTFSESV